MVPLHLVYQGENIKPEQFRKPAEMLVEYHSYVSEPAPYSPHHCLNNLQIPPHTDFVVILANNEPLCILENCRNNKYIQAGWFTKIPSNQLIYQKFSFILYCRSKISNRGLHKSLVANYVVNMSNPIQGEFIYGNIRYSNSVIMPLNAKLGEYVEECT